MKLVKKVGVMVTVINACGLMLIGCGEEETSSLQIIAT